MLIRASLFIAAGKENLVRGGDDLQAKLAKLDDLHRKGEQLLTVVSLAVVCTPPFTHLLLRPLEPFSHETCFKVHASLFSVQLRGHVSMLWMQRCLRSSQNAV